MDNGSNDRYWRCWRAFGRRNKPAQAAEEKVPETSTEEEDNGLISYVNCKPKMLKKTDTMFYLVWWHGADHLYSWRTLPTHRQPSSSPSSSSSSWFSTRHSLLLS